VILKVDDNTFEQEVLKAELPVMVDFYTDWCAPCKKMEPIVAKVASSYEGRVKVVKLNTEDARDVAKKYQIMSFPTLIVFRNGEPVTRKQGFHNEMQLNSLLLSAEAGDA